MEVPGYSWVSAVDPGSGLDSAAVNERTCLGCRGRSAKADLIRLVWDAAAQAVVADPRQVLPGRGCYVHPGCGSTAARRRVVGRALRRPVDAEQVTALLGTVAADGLA